MKVLLVSASPRLGGNGEVKGNGFNGDETDRDIERHAWMLG